MTIAKLVVMVVCLMSVPLETKEAKVTPLFSKDLRDFPGKEGLMITVEYPPGSSDPIHRHNAHAFVYVLEGSIVMQVRGGKEVTQTQAKPNRRNSQCSWSRTKAFPYWCRRTKSNDYKNADS